MTKTDDKICTVYLNIFKTFTPFHKILLNNTFSRKPKLSLFTPWKHIWEWRYRPTHSEPRYYMEWNGQPDVRADLLPETEPRSTNFTGEWVGPRCGTDVLEKRKLSWPCRNLKLRSSSPYPSRYTDWAIQASFYVPIFTASSVKYSHLNFTYAIFEQAETYLVFKSVYLSNRNQQLCKIQFNSLVSTSASKYTYQLRLYIH
jgi:hypothetical protein